jgi:hypothetical protein
MLARWRLRCRIDPRQRCDDPHVTTAFDRAAACPWRQRLFITHNCSAQLWPLLSHTSFCYHCWCTPNRKLLPSRAPAWRQAHKTKKCAAHKLRAHREAPARHANTTWVRPLQQRQRLLPKQPRGQRKTCHSQQQTATGAPTHTQRQLPQPQPQPPTNNSCAFQQTSHSPRPRALQLGHRNNGCLTSRRQQRRVVTGPQGLVSPVARACSRHTRNTTTATASRATHALTRSQKTEHAHGMHGACHAAGVEEYRDAAGSSCCRRLRPMVGCMQHA